MKVINDRVFIMWILNMSLDKGMFQQVIECKSDAVNPGEGKVKV